MGRQGSVEKKNEREEDINKRLASQYERFLKDNDLGAFLKLGLGPSKAVPLLTKPEKSLPKPRLVDKDAVRLVASAYSRSNLVPHPDIVETLTESVATLNRGLKIAKG